MESSGSAGEEKGWGLVGPGRPRNRKTLGSVRIERYIDIGRQREGENMVSGWL